MTIEVTTSAATKVAALLEAEGVDRSVMALRVAVRPGGCSGFSYEMYFDGELVDGDRVSTYPDASGDVIRVVVDPASEQLLEGATLDYRDGLNQAGFSIDNPNAQRTCGCGQSFS